MCKIISVVGPTASGKTRLSVELAKKLSAQIVSADSMQIYRKLDIGTAKVTSAEMQGITHHMINCFEPTENCSVQNFISMARNKIDQLISAGINCVLVGGTGLYVDHLIQDTQFVDMPSNDGLRKKLNAKDEQELYALLSNLDPVVAKRLHPNDKKRVVRALEIYELTGKSIVYWEELSHENSNPLQVTMIGLNYVDRQVLYDRINERVDIMFDLGLEQEVRSLKLIDGFEGSTAAEAIGYKEMIRYLNGEISIDEAKEQIKQNTRHYAKRQITWFKRNPNIHWINVESGMSFEEIYQKALEIVERN